MTVREYHEATKHTPARLRANPHTLDWANMPDPFRHYEGVPVFDLPADPPVALTPTLEIVHGGHGALQAVDGEELLSQILFYALAVSATKVVPRSGHRYALRVNASSGNLHPTECHFATNGLKGWPDGIFHYRASSHMAEQRAVGRPDQDVPLRILLTSVFWREAWKYEARAYRYCLLDAGHAAESVMLSCRAAGCRVTVCADSPQWPLADDEMPLLALDVDLPDRLLDQRTIGPRHWLGGQPNRLSKGVLPYPLIDGVHGSTAGEVWRPSRPAGRTALPSHPFAITARQRRSALDFRGGEQTITEEQFRALLAVAQGSPVRLWSFVHRVEGLPQGLYSPDLELLRRGDQRVEAAGLSLQQKLAANACVTFVMTADLERTGYRTAHYEAGAIGQRLYLAAESLGFQATGIGAFFDDEVHAYLGLPENEWPVYHFAVGHAVVDPRLGAS